MVSLGGKVLRNSCSVSDLRISVRCTEIALWIIKLATIALGEANICLDVEVDRASGENEDENYN